MSDFKFTKDNLEELAPYAKGIQRNLLEADTLLKENKIASKTLQKLKWGDLINLLFLIIGGAITYFFTNILGQDNRIETTKEIHSLKTEIAVLKSDFQKRQCKQDSILFVLKNQIKDIQKDQKH